MGRSFTFVPTKALVRVDLPALGAPTTPTCNSCCCSVGTVGTSGLYGSGTYSVKCSSSSSASSQAGKLLYTRCERCCGMACLQVRSRPRPVHATSVRMLLKSRRFVNTHTRCLLPPTAVAKAEHSVVPIFASMSCNDHHAVNIWSLNREGGSPRSRSLWMYSINSDFAERTSVSETSQCWRYMPAVRSC